jgi:hypothetical protein
MSFLFGKYIIPQNYAMGQDFKLNIYEEHNRSHNFDRICKGEIVFVPGTPLI